MYFQVEGRNKMELKLAKCTSCGASLKIEPNSDLTTCKFCNTQILVKQAFQFAKIELDRTEDIKKLRLNLAKYVKNNAIEEILRITNQILDIIPEDFLANYYFAYSKRLIGEPKFIYDFYEVNKQFTENDLEQVISHINTSSDLRDKSKIVSFLEVVAPYRTNEYLLKLKERELKEENYSLVPRDIFICFSSENIHIATNVLETLESEGYKCWISIRNLRPNDPSNYWSSITKAIESSKLVLVISSEEAMISKDVQKEVEIAKRKNKKMFEFKIDKAPHTSLFKYTFNGISWVEGFKKDQDNLKNLLNRISNEIKVSKKINYKFNINRKILLYFSLVFFVSVSVIGIQFINNLTGFLGVIANVTDNVANVGFTNYVNFDMKKDFEIDSSLKRLNYGQKTFLRVQAKDSSNIARITISFKNVNNDLMSGFTVVCNEFSDRGVCITEYTFNLPLTPGKYEFNSIQAILNNGKILYYSENYGISENFTLKTNLSIELNN